MRANELEGYVKAESERAEDEEKYLEALPEGDDGYAELAAAAERRATVHRRRVVLAQSLTQPGCTGDAWWRWVVTRDTFYRAALAEFGPAHLESGREQGQRPPRPPNSIHLS